MPGSFRDHPLWRLFVHLRGYRRQLLLATLFSILNKIADLAPPLLIGAAVDIVVARENSLMARFGPQDVSAQLWLLVGLTVIVWAVESICEYIYSVLWRNLAQASQHELRNEAYAHVQRLELAYFEDRSTGGLMAILNDDINQLERFLDGGANELLQVGTTVLVIGALFFVLAPSVAWMAMLPMPLVLWGSIAFQRRLAPRYLEVREQVGRLNGQLANNLSGIATIKSYTAERHEMARIRRVSDEYRESNRRAITLSSAFVPLIRMVIVAGFAAILLFGGQIALRGELNVGAYSVLVFMTQRLLWPLTRLGTTLDLYQRAMASTTRVLDLLRTEPQIESGTVAISPEEVRGELQLKSVTFGYGKDRSLPVLQDLSLHIPAGQTVAIVGPTGAGKSTIVKLLLRFYELQEGQILLDGRDIRELCLEQLRAAIGLVSQEVFLFPGTIRENIAYGTFDAPMEQVREAARLAEADDFIMALPDGYETVVGERGQKLSGGQRQRLSLARALLKEPPLLILDEATSAVDNETEAAIQRSLQRIAVGRTIILIAHRLSTVRHADCIFVLENGRLREQGRHDELLDHEGLYASLWRVQTGERGRQAGFVV